MQGIEVGHAVDTENHRFAIEHEMPGTVPARGLDNPGIASGPIVAVSSEKPHAIAVTDDD